MKIIFLDFDGVLNSEIFAAENKIDKDSGQEIGTYPHNQFDNRCIKLLNNITSATGAKIVISSSWRKNRTLEELQLLCKQIGIKAEVIGKTPYLSYSNHKKTVPRGCEILAWLQMNEGLLGCEIHKYRKYVIIDDESDMLFWQRENFFKTDAYCGLSPSLAYRITNFLTSF
jgi:hypothetical protein